MEIKWIGAAECNFSVGRRIYKPLGIVLHLMDGTLTGTDSWFNDPKALVSAHYGVGLNGDVHQYVKEEDTAYHAGRVEPFPSDTELIKASTGINPNFYLLGVEHEGTDTTVWSDAMIDSSAQLVAAMCQRWNIPIDRTHIIKHNEVFCYKACPGPLCPIDKIIALALSYSQQKTT